MNPAPLLRVVSCSCLHSLPIVKHILHFNMMRVKKRINLQIWVFLVIRHLFLLLHLIPIFLATINTTQNLLIKGSTLTKKRNSSSVSCKYCKKPGHMLDKCYRLHGFPSDFKFTRNKRSASWAQVEEATVDMGRAIKSSESITYGFTKEQYQHLMSLFQLAHISHGIHYSTSGDNVAYANFTEVCHLPIDEFSIVNLAVHCLSTQLGKIHWILDSGTTNHMTSNKQFSHNLQSLPKPYLITLPNGYKIKLIFTGLLQLRTNIVLHNTLLVPSFQFNLTNFFFNYNA